MAANSTTSHDPSVSPELAERLSRVRALILDVDGVLTDGGMFYGESGELFKKFNTKDGMGIARLIEAGVRVAIITGEDTQIVQRRADKLKISDVYLGIKDKLPVLEQLLARHGLSHDVVAYMGDDVNDLGAMSAVSVRFAPSDAIAEVRAVADLVTTRAGGQGAVREAAEHILSHRVATKKA